MPILWIIEHPNSELSLVKNIQGEFAVRIFASLASATTLLKIVRHDAPPDFCLVVFNEGHEAFKIFEEAFHTYFPQTPCLLLGCYEDALTHTNVIPVGNEAQDQIRVIKWLCTSPKYCHSFRGIRIDTESLSLNSAGYEVVLTKKEFKLFQHFVQYPSTFISRSDLKLAVWGTAKVSPRTVDVHISRLRKHLGPFGLSIESVYGSGYQLT